ncbi:hypothetical protein ACFRMQ_40780 [Kitasatospora sp. NPDC056783]|uniref:hypothetical protein n=1 Tax=Kitasatospora sp. NPDC056783 TaxID=3345943 RepID=UPI0036963116
MLTISRTRVVGGTDRETRRAPARDGLRRAVPHRAENPAPHAPATASSRIVERLPVIRGRIGADDTGRLTLTLGSTPDEGPTESAPPRGEHPRGRAGDFRGTFGAMTVVPRRTAPPGRPDDGL